MVGDCSWRTRNATPFRGRFAPHGKLEGEDGGSRPECPSAELVFASSWTMTAFLTIIRPHRAASALFAHRGSGATSCLEHRDRGCALQVLFSPADVRRLVPSCFDAAAFAQVTPIHDVQGPGSSSPIVGNVVTTRGIVTGVTADGFFIQDDDANVDADPATSEGIFVFTSSAPPAAAVFGREWK